MNAYMDNELNEYIKSFRIVFSNYSSIAELVFF